MFAKIIERRLFLLLPLFAGALLLAGCPNIMPSQIDPPRLILELPPDPPRITHITATNGAGKTVLDTDTNRKGETSADPAPADLDGTLTIKSTWSDGRATSHRITHTPGQPVNLFYSHLNRTWLSLDADEGGETDADGGVE
ncbi:MAG: hypothetical protein ACTSRY_00680 [Alphaproteobacteria bacterium]